MRGGRRQLIRERSRTLPRTTSIITHRYHHTSLISSSMSTNSSTATPNASTDVTADSYSPHFPLFDKADVVVRSSDGTLFATRKFHLQAASPVFEDVLELGVDGEQRDGRPVIQLQETAEELEAFLPFLHREPYSSSVEYPAIDLPLLVKMSPLVEKFQTSQLTWALYERCVPALLVAAGERPGPPSELIPSLFALAVIHGREKAAKKVLRNIHLWFYSEAGSSVMSHKNAGNQEEKRVGTRYCGLEDFPLHLLERMPMRIVQQFALLHRKVSTRTDYSWLNAADDFKVRFTIVLQPHHRQPSYPSQFRPFEPSQL